MFTSISLKTKRLNLLTEQPIEAMKLYTLSDWHIFQRCPGAEEEEFQARTSPQLCIRQAQWRHSHPPFPKTPCMHHGVYHITISDVKNLPMWKRITCVYVVASTHAIAYFNEISIKISKKNLSFLVHPTMLIRDARGNHISLRCCMLRRQNWFNSLPH